MVQVIYRQPDRKRKNEWIRYILTANDGNIDSVDLVNPIKNDGFRIMLTPLKKRLHLLDYLKVTFPYTSSKITVQMVMDCIPQDLINDVFAIELHTFFESISTATIFYNDLRNNKLVAFVALLTEKNTGKRLPTRKMEKRRPIGVTDYEWRQLAAQIDFNEKF